MTTAVLIVAGGNGTRMGAGMPKQFLPLAGRPLMVHTVERFVKALPDAAVYIALAPQFREKWKGIAARYCPGISYRLCDGGQTRFETVRNALRAMEPCDIVLVHDAVRPLVPQAVIERVVRGTQETGACIPVCEPVDSFRRLDADGSSAPVDRTALRAVQTPQGFDYTLLNAAYEHPYCEKFTDDASVVETHGHPVSLCEGSPYNIKITYPEDLIIAGALSDHDRNN